MAFIFLTEKGLTAGDYSAFGIVAVLAIGMFRLLVWMIKKKYETKDECKAFQKLECPIYDEWIKLKNQVEKLHDMHCGNAAIGSDGLPRWYTTERIEQKLDIILAKMRNFKISPSEKIELGNFRKDLNIFEKEIKDEEKK